MDDYRRPLNLPLERGQHQGRRENCSSFQRKAHFSPICPNEGHAPAITEIRAKAASYKDQSSAHSLAETVKKSPSHQAHCWWVGEEVTNDSGKPARTDHLHVFPLKWEPGVTVTRVIKATKPGLHGVGCPKARMERAGCVCPSAARRRSGPSWLQVLRTCPAPAQRQTAQPAGLCPPHQRPPPSVGTTLKNQSAPSLVTPMWSAGRGHPHFSPSPYHAFTPSLQPGFCPPTNQDIPSPKGCHRVPKLPLPTQSPLPAGSSFKIPQEADSSVSTPTSWLAGEGKGPAAWQLSTVRHNPMGKRHMER